MTNAEFENFKDGSQLKQVAYYLVKNGSIDRPTAENYLGVYRLASRINELRQIGFEIRTELMEGGRNRRRFAKYIFVE